VIKISPEGDSIWRQIYDSPSDGIDNPERVGLDSFGNLYVVGDVGRSSLAWKMDVAVVKYDPAGNQLWSYMYNGPMSLDDRMEGMAMDQNDNVIVVGYSDSSTSIQDYLVIKLLPSGDTAWVRTLASGNGTFDRFYDVAFDGAGNIYATGGITVGANYDLYLAKFSQAGDTLWTRSYASPSGLDDVPVGIGIDDSGYVYVGGRTQGATIDFLVVKYDTAGNFIWATPYDGAGGADNVRDMVADGAGNSYLVSESMSGSQRDFIVIKVDNAGSVAWPFQYDAGGNMDEIVFNNKEVIKTDGLGNVFFGGATYYVPSGATLTSTLTFKLDAAGDIVWYNRYGGPGLDFDQIRAVYVDASGNCYVTGYSTGIYANWDLFVLKFPSEIQPQVGSISGTVVDVGSQNPIEGVHVVAEGTSVDAYTNGAGEYMLSALIVGAYDVSFSCLGYEDTTVGGVQVSAGETTTLNMAMQPAGYAYLPGDANMHVGLWPPQAIGADITYIVNYLRNNPVNVPCLVDGVWASADINGSCAVDGSDVIRFVNYLRGAIGLSWCPGYDPLWPTPQDVPAEQPPGWPNCEN